MGMKSEPHTVSEARNALEFYRRYQQLEAITHELVGALEYCAAHARPSTVQDVAKAALASAKKAKI